MYEMLYKMLRLMRISLRTLQNTNQQITNSKEARKIRKIEEKIFSTTQIKMVYNST